ncbi:hypothetical protein GOP47_0002046 [Adiantum capillus-veneris]|uniref:Uncharacterized protein n=1 Tax=Adiantum capillus-veneris TaxID=13818 RepID=A0A9D4V9V8_ADICA|nr:hypothetical protein GOP47_0002046 [Adiantum capillus-veneris]
MLKVGERHAGRLCVVGNTVVGGGAESWGNPPTLSIVRLVQQLLPFTTVARLSMAGVVTTSADIPCYESALSGSYLLTSIVVTLLRGINTSSYYCRRLS